MPDVTIIIRDTVRLVKEFDQMAVGWMPGIKMSLIPSAIVPQPVKDIRCYLDVNLDAKDKSHVLSMILLGVDAWGVPVQVGTTLFFVSFS